MKQKAQVFATDRLGRTFLVPNSSIHKVETILWEKRVLVFPVELPARSRKSLVSNAPAGNEKFLLFDRNIASDAATLLTDSPKDQCSREIALAVILFMHLCKFTPAALPALHEFASHKPGIEAYDDAVTFCRALSAPIDLLLNILTAKSIGLKATDLDSRLVFDEFDKNDASFTFSSVWLCSYAATLKLVELERDGSIGKLTRMMLFLEWVYHNFFFTPPLWFIASQFLGVRREKSIIKGFNTNDSSKLRQNLRNAAWDVNLLMEWHLMLKRKQLCVLASRDNALLNIARRLRDSLFTGIGQERRILSEDWPASKEIDVLLKVTANYEADLADPMRAANRGLSREYYETMVGSLEHKLGLLPG